MSQPTILLLVCLIFLVVMLTGLVFSFYNETQRQLAIIDILRYMQVLDRDEIKSLKQQNDIFVNRLNAAERVVHSNYLASREEKPVVTKKPPKDRFEMLEI